MKLVNKMYTVGLLGTLALTSCGEKETAETAVDQPRFVKIETIEGSLNQKELIFNGKVKEERLSSLSFRVGGPLTTLNVNTGDYIEEGAIIASIDKRDYRLQVQSTKAQYDQLQGEYDRYKELFAKGKIPANSYEKIESGYLMAKTAYESALNQLNDTDLKAPFSGYIYEKQAESFQTVGPGQAIVSLLDKSQMKVIVSIPENQLQDIKKYNEIYLEVKNSGIERIPLKILSIGEKAQKDGLYEVNFIFKNNKNLGISPGMSAQVSMYYRLKNQAMKIPSQAVFFKDDTACVWIYQSASQDIELRKIDTGGITSEGQFEVLSGLNLGESIITAGVHSLFDGEKVQPIIKPSESNIGGLL